MTPEILKDFTPNHEVGLYIFILAGFLGYHVISRVPPLLHTPLMSATNAISGIALVGSIVVTGAYPDDWLSTSLGFIAVVCSATNVVGGFIITDRMLKMFKTEREQAAGRKFSAGQIAMGAGILLAGIAALIYAFSRERGTQTEDELLRYLYLLAGILFILGLKGLSSPKWARTGMFLAEFGMLVAVLGTFFHKEIQSYTWIIVGLVLGSVIGAAISLRIPMTAVPQRTALSHSLGALAATLVGISEYVRHTHLGLDTGPGFMTPLGFEVVIGGLTFTGSLMAAGKLQGLLPSALSPTKDKMPPTSPSWQLLSGASSGSLSGRTKARFSTS